MKQTIQAVRGMHDLLPGKTALWQRVEGIVQHILSTYGYRELRTPIVEAAPLFIRSVGEETDIIGKEIYLFADRHGEQLALRPEGTVGCVRAGIEHGLFYQQTHRFWYNGAMFRYERPQKGRQRQFHQIGVEVFGLSDPEVEIELILLTQAIWRALGLAPNLQLQLNTLGTAAERSHYGQHLVAYLNQHLERLDADSQRRLYTNPLRILDSKHVQMQALLADAPCISSYLSDASRMHFTRICALLDKLGVHYTVNRCLVRGLDYYSGTVFEWVSDHLGAQNTICGGGRYDGLVAKLGGGDVPAVGFSIGVERLLLLVEQFNPCWGEQPTVDIYFISTGAEATAVALQLAEEIRSHLPLVRLLTHLGRGGIKKQFRRADKMGARVALVVGERELATQTLVVKQLDVGLERRIPQIEMVPYLQKLCGEEVGMKVEGAGAV